MSRPSPTASPERAGKGGRRASPAGPANERRRDADGEAARKGVCARAPAWLHRAREVGERTPPRAREQVWGARSRRARPPPPLPPPPAPRPDPSSRVPHLHAARGSRVCARGGRPGRRVGRGGGEGARPRTARARAAAPPHGAAPEAPPTPPTRSDPRPLGTKGRSRPRLPSPRPRGPRAGSHPRTHDSQVETPSLPHRAQSGAP